MTTTGGSSLKAIATLRSAGAKIAHVVTVVDREEGAGEAFSAEGVTLHPLFRKSEFAKEAAQPNELAAAVTRRSVRLNRPPSASSVDVPAMIRSTPWKARRDSPPSTTASPELKRNDRVGSLRRVPPIRKIAASPSESDTTGASKIRFVLVLVQPHPRAGRIVVDEAGLGRMRIAGERLPRLHHDLRYRRPRFAGHRMHRLIAVAVMSDTQPSGPQFVIRTEKGLPLLGIPGV